MGYRSVLYLDDVRVPTTAGVDHVRSYAEFVAYLRVKGMPELISFDHDLAREHYPQGMNKAGERIRYGDYREATGLHCARFVVENRLDLRFWAVHSANVQGKINIERELRAYRRKGEVRGVEIPFVMAEAEPERRPAVRSQGSFSATSLLQFDEAFLTESWRSDLPKRSEPKR